MIPGDNIIFPNMQITYDGGVLNFTSLNLPLENVLWQAIVIGGEIVPEGVEITALLTPGGEVGRGIVGGSAGCNSYNASWETTDEKIEIGPAASTKMMCADEQIMTQEARYLELLGLAETYRVDAGMLEMFDADGTRMLQYLVSAG